MSVERSIRGGSSTHDSRGYTMRSMLSRAAALLLLSLPMLALAGGTLPLIPISPTDPADADQLAAPSNAAPNALHVRNDDMIETGGVIWSISGDNTAGATVNGASQYFEVLAP